MNPETYPELFQALHEHPDLVDGKEIADAIAREPAETIMRAYAEATNDPGFDLPAFYAQHFDKEPQAGASFAADISRSPAEHIDALWPVLTRRDQGSPQRSSRIDLPHPYVVPGGRFAELFYWDSYFTMLGLAVQGHHQLNHDMVENFAWFIDNHGFIPNGSRDYFRSRSQPPFFALMLQLVDEYSPDRQALTRYLPQLEAEYDFWMSERSVTVEGGRLNRYDDSLHTPRTEMYGDDLELAAQLGPADDAALQPVRTELFRNVRAACESGWDFSARWTGGSSSMTDLRTTSLAPVDLNSLLYNLEITIAQGHESLGEHELAASYRAKATSRHDLIQRYCWNDDSGLFHDYDFAAGHQSPVVSCATYFPLCFGLATEDQAERMVEAAARELLAPGGLRSTNLTTGAQWDAPNGWAPLQWMAVTGLRRYGFRAHAQEIAQRWTALNEDVYARTGRFVEKYNVDDLTLEAGGGEYELQDGFGWTNGVYLALVSGAMS